MMLHVSNIPYTHEGTLTEREGSVQLTSFYLRVLDQLLLIMQILYSLFTKQATVMRRSTVLVSIPCPNL